MGDTECNEQQPGSAFNFIGDEHLMINCYLIFAIRKVEMLIWLGKARCMQLLIYVHTYMHIGSQITNCFTSIDKSPCLEHVCACMLDSRIWSTQNFIIFNRQQFRVHIKYCSPARVFVS